MSYLYEMHLHTSPCSKCARSPIEAMVDRAAEIGFSGFVVTNHFFCGNTGIDRETNTWEEFVGAYAADWERGRAYGETRGIDVLFGVEQGYGNGKEVLIYGLSPEDFIRHPEMRRGDLATLSGFVRSCGGLLYHAHPFRDRPYISNPDDEPDPVYLDGVEIFNAANAPGENEKAAAYAKRFGLPGSAGSDTHRGDTFGSAGLAFDTRIRTNAELVDALKKGQYRLFADGKILTDWN